jgi:pimeloyl-ACP methyl ester carboxylesterase
MKPTVILIHGAFAESSSWDGVIDPLLDSGHPVIAAANPLRSLAADAAAVSDLVRTVDGPVVLVGHSYGGAVLEIPGASHAISVSHPEAVAHQILEAAAVRAIA